MLHPVHGPAPGSSGWSSTLVLIHGIDGHMRSTWDLDGPGPWPQRTAERLRGLSVLSADLPHRKFRAQGRIEPDIEASARELIVAMAALRLLDRPCVLVAHSLGGLAVKRAICDVSAYDGGVLGNSPRRLRAIVFLGVPHRGSPRAACRESCRVFRPEPHGISEAGLASFGIWTNAIRDRSAGSIAAGRSTFARPSPPPAED